MNNETEEITQKIVNKQLDAYNRCDYETFASCYQKDILSFDLNTSEQIQEMSGANFFEHYSQKFLKNPKIHCAVIQRIVQNNLIIDKERISNYQGSAHDELVIYQVDNGLISKMWFRR